MRLFELHREPRTPGTKLSRVTLIGEGVEFSDGTVVVRFESPSPHTVIYSQLAAVEMVDVTAPLRGRLVVSWIFDAP